LHDVPFAVMNVVIHLKLSREDIKEISNFVYYYLEYADISDNQYDQIIDVLIRKGFIPNNDMASVVVALSKIKNRERCEELTRYISEVNKIRETKIEDRRTSTLNNNNMIQNKESQILSTQNTTSKENHNESSVKSVNREQTSIFNTLKYFFEKLKNNKWGILSLILLVVLYMNRNRLLSLFNFGNNARITDQPKPLLQRQTRN